MTLNPFPFDGVDATAEELRFPVTAAFDRDPFAAGTVGVPTVGNPGFGVLGDSLRVSGAGSTVTVARGAAVIKGSETALQGSYVVPLQTAATISGIPTAATQRYDLITLQVRDSDYSGGNQDGPVARTQGTASSTPSDPTPPASSIVLARLRVNNTGVYQVDDLRPHATAQGGEITCTSTTRPSTVPVGTRIFELDTGNHLVYYGPTTGWQKPWSQPWGELTTVVSTSDFAVNLDPYVDVPGTTATLTLPANRLVEARYTFLLGGVSGTSNPRVSPVCSAGTSPAGTPYYEDGFSGIRSASAFVVVQTAATGGPANYTIKLQAGNSGGTGAFKLYNTAVRVCGVFTDIGPAGAPIVT